MVAKKFAGPGVIISFAIAAMASIFSGKSTLTITVLNYVFMRNLNVDIKYLLLT